MYFCCNRIHPFPNSYKSKLIPTEHQVPTGTSKTFFLEPVKDIFSEEGDLNSMVLVRWLFMSILIKVFYLLFKRLDARKHGSFSSGFFLMMKAS